MGRVLSLCIVGLLVVAGCRNEPPPTVPLTPVAAGSSAVVGCGTPIAAGELPDAAARFDAIGGVVAAIREGGCGVVEADARLCRGLFLIAATDPLAGLAAGLHSDQFDQLAEWHRWALADAAIAAELLGESATEEALRILDGVAASITSANSSTEITDAAVARADRSIIEPLAAAELSCLSQPR